MPKGRHKGARRQFTDFEAEAMRKEREEKEATWRARRGELPSDEEKEGSGSGSTNESESSESESESSEGEEEPVKVPKAKGVSGLIEVENPNRQVGKSTIKASQLDPNAPPVKPELTRREREELQKQRDAAHYRKLHAAGKTDEARADLERLAIIKQKRAEAEQKRKDQQEAKDAAAASKKESLAKASGKKKS